MENFFYLSIFLNVCEVRVTWNLIKVIEEIDHYRFFKNGVLAFLDVEISYGYSDFSGYSWNHPQVVEIMLTRISRYTYPRYLHEKNNRS